MLATKAANYILRFTKLTLCIYEVNILRFIGFLSLLRNIQA